MQDETVQILVTESVQVQSYRNVFSTKIGIRSARFNRSDEVSLARIEYKLAYLKNQLKQNLSNITESIEIAVNNTLSSSDWSRGDYCVMNNFNTTEDNQAECPEELRPHNWQIITKKVNVEVEPPSKADSGNSNYINVKKENKKLRRPIVQMGIHLCCRGGQTLDNVK